LIEPSTLTRSALIGMSSAWITPDDCRGMDHGRPADAPRTKRTTWVPIRRDPQTAVVSPWLPAASAPMAGKIARSVATTASPRASNAATIALPSHPLGAG